MVVTIQNPKVRQILELLDSQFQQGGMPSYKALEEALVKASEGGDKSLEANIALQMGIRLLSIATVSRALKQNGQDASLVPSEADVLEPAIDLFNHSLESALTIRDEAHEKLARNRLADCYVQTSQFEKALEHLQRSIEMCDLPEDAFIYFDATQKVGDCYLELENDKAALSWYEQAMSTAEEIDDPFEIHVQHGKIASALYNLKRYDEALHHYTQARDLLVRIGNDRSLQQRISVHKNTFSVSALPKLIAYTDERISHTRDALGRDLLREMPGQLAKSALAALTNRSVPSPSDWSVFRELDTAVRSATAVLSELLKTPENVIESKVSLPEAMSTLRMVGSLARYHFGGDIADPENVERAARLLVQIDRSRRAARHVEKAEASVAGPGPFGGGTSRLVVYLRSFVASPRLPRFEVEPWGQVDLEELFSCMLDRSPLIALGNPDLERFGPGRARTSEENWREVLRALTMEAQMILVVPAPTGGTSWEVEWVVTNKFLHKTCFVMPPPGAGEEAWWADNWAKLKDWTVRLGLNLPEYTPQGCVFKLTSEGLVTRMDFSEIYDSVDLHMTLLTRLLMAPDYSFITYDFLYGAQQTFEQSDNQERSVGEVANVIGADDVSAEHLATLFKLEADRRFDFSNWHFDEPQIPNSPGVLLFYENPFRLLWAEEVNDLHDALDRHAQGEASDFTRALFHLKILPILGAREVSQLLDKSLSIESVMSFRIKQLISYRFCALQDPEERTNVVDLILRGASKHGTPQLTRPE